MARSKTIYDLLLDRACSGAPVRRILLGLNWSVGEVEACGLCFSPSDSPRTLDWPGTLSGRAARDVTPWIRSLEPTAATVGAAIINAVVNGPENTCLQRSTPLEPRCSPHLAVFEHFAPLVSGARVVVVGRYPGLERVWSSADYACLERRTTPGTFPESVAGQVLSGADWVFLTASSLVNKTLPRLLTLSRGARVVLMGPSLPWLGEWADFGVHYLAGVSVADRAELFRVAGEAGGTRIFADSVRYRVLAL